MAGKRRTCRASGRKAPGIMCSSFLPGSGRDADAQGSGRASLMTGTACVFKERVPASLRIRLSEALAKAGRAFFLSESSRDPRPDPQATAGGIPVPVIEIARKPETPKAERPIVCDRTGNCSGRLAKQLARGGARPPRLSGKTAARGACRNMALQILRAVVYLSLMTVCGTGLSPCRTNAKGTQNARENFLLHF